MRNTLANGAGQFLTVAISLVMTPFLIDGLGVAAYGVFTLALTFTFFGGYAALADLGVEHAAARYVAEALSDGDLKRASRTVVTALGFFSAIAIVITPLIAGLASVLAELFDVPADLENPAKAVFALVAAQLLFDLPSRAFFAVLEGAQHFTVYQAIEVTRAIVQAALFTVALATGVTVEKLGFALVISSAVVLVAAVIAARRTLPELELRPSLWSRATLRKLVTFGGGLVVLRLMGTLHRQMDKVIIGAFLGVRPVTPYEVANKLHAGAGLVQTVASSALLPATAYIRTKRETLRELYLRGTSYSLAATLPVIAAGFIFAPDLIRTWIGGSVTDEAAEAARLFFVYLAVVTVHVVGSSMIVALGKLRWVMTIAIAIVAVNLVISLALVESLGIDGVVLGTVIANALAFPALLVLFLREFDVSVGVWLRRVVYPNVPGLAVQAVTAPALVWVTERSDNLLAVAAIAALSVALSLVAFMYVGLNAEQRATLLSTLRSALGLTGGAQADSPA